MTIAAICSFSANLPILFMSLHFSSNSSPINSLPLAFQQIVWNLSAFPLHLTVSHFSGLEQWRVCRKHDSYGQTLVDNNLMCMLPVHHFPCVAQVHNLRLGVPVPHPSPHHCQHLHPHLLLPQGACSRDIWSFAHFDIYSRVSLRGFVVCDKSTKNLMFSMLVHFVNIYFRGQQEALGRCGEQTWFSSQNLQRSVWGTSYKGLCAKLLLQ